MYKNITKFLFVAAIILSQEKIYSSDSENQVIASNSAVPETSKAEKGRAEVAFDLLRTNDNVRSGAIVGTVALATLLNSKKSATDVAIVTGTTTAIMLAGDMFKTSDNNIGAYTHIIALAIGLQGARQNNNCVIQ